MSERLNETLDILRAAATKSDSVAVMYSGGKDSLAVMDLCMKTFKRVEAVHMYFVPGLEHEQERMDFCKSRWGITPIEIPHWVSFASLRGCAFIDPWPELSMFPDHKLKDIYEWARQLTGCDFVAVGAKAADSSWRRRFMKGTAHWDTVINPLKSWNKFDVLAFLQSQSIPVPQQSGSNASGIGLTFKAIKWIAELYPRDYERIKEYFPYVEAFKAHARYYPENAQ